MNDQRITSKELRIANWIHDGYNEIRINGDAIAHLYQSERPLSNIDPPPWKPVPLTEEWLLKFGFEKPAIHYLKLAIGDHREDLQSSLQIAFSGCGYVQVCRAGINAYSAKAEYVHQLQNLYFALTGKELELTPSTV